MNMFRPRFIFLTILIVVAALAACQRSLPPIGAGPNQIAYTGPVQKAVSVGEFLPGTGVQYLGVVEERGAELRIDGQVAYKRVADSVDWRGSPVPGVDMAMAQRVLFYNADSLRLGGVATIVVDDPSPQALGQLPDAPISYGVPVTYNVKVGEAVPGTRLVVNRIDPELGIEFSGWATEQYPYRKAADSVQWDGALRPGVSVSYQLRVALIGEESVQLAGVVNVLLTP